MTSVTGILVFTSFNFEGGQLLLALFIFYHNSGVNITFNTICVGIELLLSCHKILEKDSLKDEVEKLTEKITQTEGKKELHERQKVRN